MVVQKRLWLDRRVVAHRDGTIGFALSQALRRFDDGERAADAMVGDAGVRALEPVADADVTEDVVG